MHVLAEVRKKAGMSQAELGRRLGIDPSIVRHVEAGRTQAYPRFRRLCSEIFKVPEHDLFPEICTSSEDCARSPEL